MNSLTDHMSGSENFNSTSGARPRQNAENDHISALLYDRQHHLPDSKTGAKTIPLNGPALEILAEIERVEGNPYVIVGTKEGTCLQDPQKPWRRVCWYERAERR